jgi:TetR/AcrR family transcriptional regulator, lmrAB and yxaGH operons repressor
MAQQTIDDGGLTKALFETFRKHGFEGTTIALLSEVTGLKKSSLYHHFPAGKEDMAIAVVAYVQSHFQREVIAVLLDKKVTPEQRFSQMLTSLQQFFENGTKNCLLNVFSLGEAKPEMRQKLNAIYDTFLYALEKLAQEIGVDSHEAKLWSERFLIFLEGALVIQRLTKNKVMFSQQMEYEQQQFNRLLAMTANRSE